LVALTEPATLMDFNTGGAVSVRPATRRAAASAWNRAIRVCASFTVSA
jgi:hypothetical protein